MKNKKTVLKFIIIFILSFLVLEGVEFLLSHFFGFNIHQYGKLGWLGIMILYGFKYHILCCLIPAIWATYKCRHKKCDHDYCDHS